MAEIKIDSEELVHLKNKISYLEDENREQYLRLTHYDETTVNNRIKEEAIGLFNIYLQALFQSVGMKYIKNIHYIKKEDLAEIFNGNATFQIQLELKEGVKAAYLKIVSLDE